MFLEDCVTGIVLSTQHVINIFNWVSFLGGIRFQSSLYWADVKLAEVRRLIWGFTCYIDTSFCLRDNFIETSKAEGSDMREVITDTLTSVRLSLCQYSCLIFWNIRVASLPLLLFWTYFLPAYGRRYRGEWWWCFSNWRTGWRAQPMGAGADKKRNQYPSGKN